MFIEAGGITFHVQVSGSKDAPVLLLLHSLGTNLHVWDDQEAVLAGRFRVVRPDLRGHGLTAVPPGPYTIDAMAQDVLAIMDALGVAAAHVGGLSIGGMVAQSLAAQAPDRVASLILCDTAMMILPAEMWRERAAIARDKGLEPLADAVMARWVTAEFRTRPPAAGLRAMLLRTAPEGYAAAAEAIAAADLSLATKKVRVPTLVLVGERDEATPLASAEALHSAIDGARLEILPGAAHIPTVETPDAVSREMASFLASLASAASPDAYEAGLAVRKRVLGEAHVAHATAGITELDRDFQRFITSTAWGGVWTRPHFDRRMRSIVTLALLAGLGHDEEFRLHVRATRNTGATLADLGELLMHVAVYAGVPAANSAIRAAKEVLKEMNQ
ncbi:MAG: 3-oxoadipate enol-lactonase [Alphaproteobacteria bacterium]|nr:3-oxoadipate enol-lactonase [Alphaproteobacteria bacterium]